MPSASTDLRCLLMDEDTYRYLIHVFQEYLKGGANLDELPVANSLRAAIQKSQTVDFSKLNASGVELTEKGIGIDIADSSPEVK